MVDFDIKRKVAIVTGGAAGIGFQFARQLLKKQAKVRKNSLQFFF